MVEVVQEGPGATSLRIAGRRLDRLHAAPGQFFIWRFLAPGHRWWAHPFSERMNGDVAAICRVLAPEDIVVADELEELRRARGVELHYVIGDHATDEGGSLLSPEHLGELVPDLAEREVYPCGPPR